MFLVLGVVPRRLGEAVVEVAEAAAGDMRHHAIEDHAVLLVGVEAPVQELPQKPAALRYAEAVRG